MRKLIQSVLTQSRGPIARSSIRSVVIRTGGLAVAFVQAILAARILGARGYGIASVALSAAQIAATLAAFGFGSLAVRELARLGAADRGDAVSWFVQTSSRRVTALALLAGGALSATTFTNLIPESYRSAVLIGGLVVPPLALLQLQRGVSQGLGRIVTALAPGELLRPVLVVAFLSIAAATQLQLEPHGYVTALAVASLLALGASLPFTLRAIPHAHMSAAAHSAAGKWRSESMPFLAMALVGILLGEINTLLLGWLTTPREAGMFQPVARLAPVMVLPVQAAGMRFAPRVAELWEKGRLDQIRHLRRVFTIWTLALTALVSVSLAAAGPWILQAFGREFAGSAMLLWIVAGAQIFNAACGPVGMLLTMRGRSRAALAGQLAGLVVSSALGLWLIPDHGALGAAISMAGGIVAWNLVMLAQLRTASDGRR
jgi:O-antigen/teichoic acid export membrane protein